MQSEVQPPLTHPDLENGRDEQISYFEGAEAVVHQALDRITRTAALTFDVSMAFLSFVGTRSQTVKSLHGLPKGFGVLPREQSICQHTITSNEPTVILDALIDPRSATCPAVTGEPSIRYYVGAPLITESGMALGALCVAEIEPRESPLPRQLEVLRQLAAEAVDQLQFFVAKRDLLAYEEALVRKEKELEQQRRSATRYELRSTLALEAGQLGVWEWDAKTNRSYWSPSLSRIFGLNPDDHDGATWTWLSYIIPEDRSRVIDHLQRARTGAGAFELTYRICHQNGSIRSLCDKGAFQRDSSGRIESAMGVCWDVTEQEASRRELLESEELFRRLSFSCPLGVFRADLNGHTVYVNPKACEIWRLPADEMHGRGWIARVHPEDLDRLLNGWIEASVQGKSFECVYRLLLDDASVRWVEGRSAVLMGSDGQPVGTVGTLVDITESRELEDRLRAAKDLAEQASQAKNLMLANVSHELRTPLNGILGMTDLLLDTALTPEQRDFLQVIQHAGHSLVQIVNDLLDLSAAQTGELRLENRDFNVRRMVAAAMAVVRSEAAAKGLTLDLDGSSEFPTRCLGDEDRIRQVLLCFLSNAVKFTAVGGIIVNISTIPSAVGGRTMLTFSVVDTGAGISVADQVLLFHPFTQVDASSTRRHGGAGLGLALSRRLALLMGGEAGVESQVGSGSRFWLSIPLRLPS